MRESLKQMKLHKRMTFHFNSFKVVRARNLISARGENFSSRDSKQKLTGFIIFPLNENLSFLGAVNWCVYVDEEFMLMSFHVPATERDCE